MMLKFLKERRSWILFFIVLQLMIFLIGYMDASIPTSSIVYILLLSSIFFILFLVIRYNRETKFYKELQEWDLTDDINAAPEASAPFEQITASQAQDQLDHYKKLLETRLNQLELEKDELLSWMHEIKTPLTAMQLMIDRVEDKQLASQLRFEWLRIHLLIDQQLHQRRIPSIKNDLYIEKTSLQPIIYQEIKALQSWCMQKGIGFDVSFSETDVYTDEKWLGFVLRQLLTNAVKYSADADIVICSENQQEQVALTIRDFGRGIDQRDLPRIFDKGFTSTADHNNSTSTGMGLYLAKKVADSLNIRMQVASRLHEGSSFTLTFPKRNEFIELTGM
jgi:OmpR family two-component system bacitracin resistance sensor histidine kinase BceS